MRWAVVALVALAVLSGCAGPFDQEPTSTVTPVDVPTVEQRSQQYPAGLDDRGLTSVSELTEGHVRALDGRSYVWEIHKCRQYVGNESEKEQECGFDRITYVDDSTYRRIHSPGPDSGDAPQFDRATAKDSYANGTTVFRRFQTADRVWYDGRRANGAREAFSFSAKRILQLYLTVNESTVERVERDGEIAYRVVGTDHPAPAYSDPDDYRVVAFVDPSGLVCEFRVVYRQPRGNSTSLTTFHAEYRDVGEATIDSPSWLAAARENVSVSD